MRDTLSTEDLNFGLARQWWQKFRNLKPGSAKTRHSKINNLPPELLAHIFSTAMFGLINDESNLVDSEQQGVIQPVFHHSPTTFPLLFCQICSYWRQVAISCPELWSSIAIGAKFKQRTIKLWLERSRSYPLSFLIYEIGFNSTSRTMTGDTIRGNIPQLFDILRQHIGRWKHVGVDTYLDSQDRWVEGLISSIIPVDGKSPAVMLHTFHVARYSAHRWETDVIGKITARPPPMLRRITWGHDIGSWFDSRLKASTLWSNLQEIKVSKISFNTTLRMLELCPNLHVLNISNLQHNGDDVLIRTPVLAPNLQIININRPLISIDICTLLAAISAPKLAELFFRTTSLPFSYDALAQQLQRFPLVAFLMQCTWYKEHEWVDREIRGLLRHPTIKDIPNVALVIRVDAAVSSASLETFASDFLASQPDSHTGKWKSKSHDFVTMHMGWGTVRVMHHTYEDVDKYPFLVPEVTEAFRVHVGKGSSGAVYNRKPLWDAASAKKPVPIHVSVARYF